jgi:hypothetical protein
MTKQVDELMKIGMANAFSAKTKAAKEKALRTALEAALKPGVLVAEVIADEEGYAFIKWHGDESRFHEIHPIGTKFYTAPPAQTPVPPRLTDADSQKMWDVACYSIPGWSRHLTYARAIESAVRKQFGVKDE